MLMRHKIVAVATLLNLLFLFAIANSELLATEKLDSKPNIVVIFVDDLGYADIGPYGATLQKTPHLDRMATEGMKLTSFYAAHVCSVSRAQLLTGCYGTRISVPGVYFPGQPQGLNPDEITIAERMKELGYATACVGKWHVGDQPDFLPTNQGFDHYFGIPYSNDMQRKAVGGSERVIPLLRDDQVHDLLSDEQQSQIIEWYTDEAIRFIQNNKDQPFFLYYAHTAVHTPIYPGAAFRGKSNNGRYGDWVEEVDWSVGQVLDTIKQQNLDEKTLVIFTSDNGPWLIKGSDGGSALPLRGGKGSTWEGGVRVPTIARWPGKISAGTVCDTVTGTIDLLPTFVSLAGGQVPAEPAIDGRDMSRVLLQQSTESPREAHYYFAGYNLQAVRQGPWKLAIATQAETMGKGAEKDAQVNPRLYNLDVEIGERTNLADQHPQIVAKLQALATKVNAEIGGKDASARRPAGEVKNPQTLYPIEETPQRGNLGANQRTSFKPADLVDLKPGDTLSANAAPMIANRPFTISCVVQTSQSDTVFVAHGGLMLGYALHLRDGCPVFIVRQGGGEKFTEIVSPETIQGVTQLTASLSDDRTMTLRINGKTVASKKTSSLIPKEPAEEFCLGHDSANPVTDYSDLKPFQGEIRNVTFGSP